MNSITEGKDRALAPDADGVIVYVPTPAVVDLTAEITESAQFKMAGQKAESRARSSIESRTDLRIAATNEAMRADPQRESSPLVVSTEVARQWADLDASDYPRIRSTERREFALEAIAEHMRASPEYADEIKKRSPSIAVAAGHLNEVVKQLEDQRLAEQNEKRMQMESESRAAMRLSLIDAAAMAALDSVRKEQSASALAMLQRSADPVTRQDIADRVDPASTNQQLLKLPPLDGKVTGPNDPDIAARAQRQIKRPVGEDDLPDSIRQRYIVTTEKAGLISKGQTEFTLRGGNKQGQVAFVDAGKRLTTTLEDKETIRVMIEVASAKNWKEVTVSGTDEFRRAAWLEARINGMDVHGYEPREADKKILADLMPRVAAPNAISLEQRELRTEQIPKAPQDVPSGSPAKKSVHIDGDQLTPGQKTVLDNSRSFLKAQDFGPEFTDSAIKELESKIRGERVYVGEVISHGSAPFKFVEKNNDSYFVKLKTPTGEQVVWGKELAAAMANKDVDVGQKIVLQNTGKRNVTVTEPVLDNTGKKVGTREKDAVRNEWTAQPLALFSEQARGLNSSKQASREPSMRAYDPNAQRAATPAAPAADIDRAPPMQRSPRDR